MLTLKWGTSSGVTEGAFELSAKAPEESEEVPFQLSQELNLRHELNASLASATYQDNATVQPSAWLSLVAIRF